MASNRPDEAVDRRLDRLDEVVERTDSGMTDGYSNLATMLVGLFIPGNLGLVLGAAAGPMVGQLLAFLRERVLPLRQESARRMVNRVQDETGMRIEDFLQTIAHHPSRLLLLGDAMEAASRTVIKAKIDALGETVAIGGLATDDAVVDCEFLVEAALADMETPHLRVLMVMTGGGRYGVHSPRWSDRDLAEELPDYRLALAPVLATLARHGVIISEQPDVAKAMRKQRALENATRGGGSSGLSANPGPPTWKVTGFGKNVWQRLAKHGAGGDPSSEHVSELLDDDDHYDDFDEDEV